MERKLTTVAEHTVDLDLIKRDSKVLDLGCRSFSWSTAMLEYVDKIGCVDADPEVKSSDERLTVVNVAVGEGLAKLKYFKSGNGTGNFIGEHRSGTVDTKVHEMITVPQLTLKDILILFFKSSRCDIIKVDIEGSEIPILMSLSEPPADQLSVEFHMHCGTSEAQVKLCMQHLKQWYDIVFCDYSRKHGLAENYWDVLFIKK